MLAVDEVLQTARSGNDHAGTLADGLDLSAFGQAADDQSRGR